MMNCIDTTDQAAVVNRQAWDSIWRQRDEGLIDKHHDVAADILAGKTSLTSVQRKLAGDITGKRLLDLGCGDGFELLEWAQAGAHVVGVDNSPQQLAAAQRAADRFWPSPVSLCWPICSTCRMTCYAPSLTWSFRRG